MIEQIAPHKFLDNKNRELWLDLSRSMSIHIERSQEPNYGCYCINDYATIYVTNKISSAFFTHELLHVKLRSEGLLAGCYFKRVIQENVMLKNIISEETIIVITNCMEHVKMLPYFLCMGYANEEFIDDYYKSKMNGVLLLFVKYHFLHGNKKWAFEHLIGWIVAMKADNNPVHSYHKFLTRIASFAPEIYTATIDFWDAWIAYDITKTDEWNSPKDFGEEISNFVNKLEKIILMYS